MNRIMRKPEFCLCGDKEAGQHRAADQRLCFWHIDSSISLLPNCKISVQPVCVGPVPTYSCDVAHIFQEFRLLTL